MAATTRNYETETEPDTSDETIGLFGGQSATGKHFIKLALDAGYCVRALVPSASGIELQNDQLTVIEGSLEDADKIEETVRCATYVVCMLGDTLPKGKGYKDNLMLNFIKTLFPLMKESCTRIFLYQATSLTVDAKGYAPIFSRILKETANVFGSNPPAKDNDNVVKYVTDNTDGWFHYIITRPGIIREGPSKKRLAASKSLPGPVPVTHVDLAEFTLGALKTEKLYDSCPYVVGDGFF